MCTCIAIVLCSYKQRSQKVSRQKAVETPVHQETRLEAERSRTRRKREARIPTQVEDPETNYVISLRSSCKAYIHLVIIIIIHWMEIHEVWLVVEILDTCITIYVSIKTLIFVLTEMSAITCNWKV